MGKNFLLFLFFSFFFLFFLFSSSLAATQPITNLSCVSVGQKILLSWTPPAGTTGYEIRYSLSTINEQNFNLATIYPQNLSGSASQTYIEGLPEEKTWFFAIKTKDDSGQYSLISNVVWCYLPKKESQKDNIPPTSLILQPENNSVIPPKKDYLLKGICSDSGGSSVKKVEISFDNGVSWQETNPVQSKDSGFFWEYLWQDPKEGTYYLKTRATDWWENQETPKEAIQIRVEKESFISSEIQPEKQKQIEQIRIQIIETLKSLLILLIQEIQAKIVNL